jgi:PAS domain S-box-containing protein
MNTKPTYKELEQKIKLLEKKIIEIEGNKKTIQRSEERLKEAERIAKIGHWELDLVNNTLYWSDEIYRIFDLNPQEFGATYEAFLDTVHPDDRKAVDKAFTESVKKKAGYDIVHRLLLKNGTLKYVQEKCRTLYDEDGKPLRSLGTVQDITHQKLDEHRFSGIIGRDPKMKDIFEMIREITDVDIPVLIQGESGTGKELVARAIHNEGPRVHKAFVPVNCGALPEGLLESELFGHVKGSFTGAMRDRKGRFEMANGGTLFLDEIADLPKVVQAKLLRVLQEGKFERVGDEKTISVDVRIISAANRNLKQEVEKGNFRDDLYYRISVVPIHMPPLRKRKDDIPLLVNNFLKKAAYKEHKTKTISESALSVMMDYSWPGNVRELQSAIHYALIKSRGKIIQPAHLPIELRTQKNAPLSRGPSLRLDSKVVKEALIRSGGNKAKAARYLGVGRATLYRFLKNFPNIASNIYESE